MLVNVPARQIRARFTDQTVTVYQAYPASIALPAAAAGGFPADYNRSRMTWIKPSFLWMMHRRGWATSPGQEHVLAIEITRDGFHSALGQAVASSYTPRLHTSRDHWRRELRRGDVRFQWDPERDLNLQPLPWRSLQVGLSGEAVHQYLDSWIVGIADVTPLAHRIRRLILDGETGTAATLLPPERPYPLPLVSAARLGAE
ncbi:DUF4291 domain-containing protein [Streptacidiphilus neutrinimicus]|uniref:DUF4291 domain-containing protein n=1 Tax=Streptacidiphilus neutrinimicus TaxID=105420 RepID=UPI0005A97A64|nr:DUF4291 domain-containing protein [Streptacidiphilus neutrinimicus]